VFLRRALEIAHLGWWKVELRSPTGEAQSLSTWSDEVYRIFGHEPGAFAATTDRFYGQVLPEDLEAVQSGVQRALDGGSLEYTMEHRIVRTDGSVRLVEVRATVERDTTDDPIRVVGTIVDITDRRRIEMALNGSHAGAGLLSQIVAHSHDAILSVAPDGVITTWNPAAERVFGWKAAEIIGRHAGIMIPTDRLHELDDCLSKAERGEAYASFETLRVHRDGSAVNVEISSSPIFDSAGLVIGASAIIRDTTQQRRIGAQLQHAQRLESVGRLAGGVAHDFNNLLMAITGYAELLRMDLPADAPAQDDLRSILASTERGARLTRQLLAFGRRQVLHPVQLDLNMVLRDMEGVLRPLVGGDVTLRLDLWPTATLIRADRAQIEQAVVNLVANARDAMAHGGTLDVATAIVEVGNDGPTMHATVEPGTYVRLVVADTGIGMDAEVQSRLFEPFFTTKPRGTSTGMGLATTYGIVKQSGGFITVESVPDLGTTVRTFLPFVPTTVGEARTTERASPDITELVGGDETILLVEDDASVRTSAKAMLERLGYEVLDTATPARALELLAACNGAVDLLITDILLPEMSGVQLGEIALARYPALRVIRISGYAGDDAAAASAADIPYLQKPFTAETLARAIRRALAE